MGHLVTFPSGEMTQSRLTAAVLLHHSSTEAHADRAATVIRSQWSHPGWTRLGSTNQWVMVPLGCLWDRACDSPRPPASDVFDVLRR